MTENKKKTGRHPKKDPAVYRYTVRFNAEEHVRFLSMFDESGAAARSVFIKQQFFSQPFRVIKTGQDAARLLHQALVFSRAIPRRGQQLQPSRQGTARAFFREKGNGTAL